MVSGINVSLSNLRAVVIILVVAFHAVLPYLTSQPASLFAFEAAPYRWISFPILDPARWFGFDLFCAWQDVSLMSLMFFLAGVFTPASLNRKGSRAYLSERWRRIGLPFLLAAGALSPMAYYASYRASASDPGVAAFWQHWQALPMWPAGPAWFLWQLFLLCALAAALRTLSPRCIDKLGQLAGDLSDRPLAFFAGLTALSILAYVPLAMVFNPWDWTYLGPLSFQLSRPLHYMVYFCAGLAVGSHGPNRGLLRSGSPLAHHWPAWLAAAVASFAIWGGLTSLTMPDWSASPFAYRLAAALVFPLACSTGALCLLAVCLQTLQTRNRLLDSLSDRAYSIYLVHYVPVVWLQYALLGINLNAVEKAGIVFTAALALSWTASIALTALVQHHLGLPGKSEMSNQPR